MAISQYDTELPIESEEELSYLKNEDLPQVREHKSPNEYLIKAVFKGGNESFVRIPEEFSAMLSAYSPKGPINIPQPPYSAAMLPKVMSMVLLAASSSPEKSISKDKKVTKDIANKMLETPPEEWGELAKIDHFKVVHYEPGLHMFGGDPAGDTVAIVQLDGSTELLEDEEFLSAPHELEFLREGFHPLEKTELTRSQNIYNPEDKNEFIGQHHKRWQNRFEEAQRRKMDQRYAPDLYDGDETSPEVPYQDMDTFEDFESEDVFSQPQSFNQPTPPSSRILQKKKSEEDLQLIAKLAGLADYLDQHSLNKEADILDLIIQRI